eukprot:TRINITY_DN539_c0_g2_i9.p1 TRINITY_DN539_c0_g2~~TRINITY_DN539_c0_g2_i9.p1  ORF type:complete len:148 (-),score=23.95 TRINITY_DN539_c0_g2_i9:99-542(-)
MHTTIQGVVSKVAQTHGITTLWRGTVLCAGREAFYTLGYLGLADLAKKRLERQEYFQTHTLASSILGAMIGGTIGSLLSHPMDTAKTCIQSDLSGQVWKTIPQTFGNLYSEGGLRTMYKGGCPRTIRACGAAFVIQNLKQLFLSYKE